MATDTRKPAQPAAEAHILYKSYKETGYVYTLSNDPPSMELIPADRWQAIQVSARLAGKE